MRNDCEYMRARAETRPDPDVYVRAKPFTDEVKRSKFLTWQQKKTLCGQAWHGDLSGARKGYAKLVGREEGRR